MTAIALSAPRFAQPRLITELLERQPLLTRYAAALVIAALFTAALQMVDPRTVNGVNTWVKPTKFFVSVGVFTLTTAWFFGYVRPERRRAPLLRGTVAVLIAAATFELLWITWQASQGQDSHFNLATPFTTLMYQLMGVFAVLLAGTTLPLAWEIARRPAAGLKLDYTAAVVLGLVLTFLLPLHRPDRGPVPPGHRRPAPVPGLIRTLRSGTLLSLCRTDLKQPDFPSELETKGAKPRSSQADWSGAFPARRVRGYLMCVEGNAHDAQPRDYQDA